MTEINDVMTCSISSWFPLFQKQTIPSTLILLDQNFIDYLLLDGTMKLPNLHYQPLNSVSQLSEDEDEDKEDKNKKKSKNSENKQNESDESESDSEEEEEREWVFPELEKRIIDTIEEYGSVVPKLNWSCPKDAVWLVHHGTLKCETAADVFLLLKGSDNTVVDLLHAFDHCIDYNKETFKQPPMYLCLRKWTSQIHPSMEFRCFVKNSILIGISQRNHFSHFPFLISMKNQIFNSINELFTKHIREKFPLKSFVFDVYITKSSKVKIIDFSTFGEPTESLLFTWDELKDINELTNSDLNSDNIVRLTKQDDVSTVTPSPNMYFGFPDDITNMNTKDIYNVISNIQKNNKENT